jgi:hypothetical protein
MKSERQRPLLCEVGARPLRDEPRGWDEGAATLREVEPLHLGPGGYRWHLELGEAAIDGAWSPGTGGALGAWPGEWAAGGLTRHWTTTPCKGRVAGCASAVGEAGAAARRAMGAAGAAGGGHCGRWGAIGAAGNDRGGGAAAEVGEERSGGAAAEVGGEVGRRPWRPPVVRPATVRPAAGVVRMAASGAWTAGG